MDNRRSNQQNDSLDSPYAPPGTTEADRTVSAPDAQTQALRALLHRPGFSIRARLALGFMILFILSTGITIISIVTIGRIEHKLRFLEDADSFTSEIQQARRYEKNFFLYGSDLENVIEHVEQAEILLNSARLEWTSVVGSRNVQTMENHLESYKELIRTLEAGARNNKVVDSAASARIEKELRSHGGEMISFAMGMSRKERDKIHRMLYLARHVPVAFLILLLVIMVYLANFLATHIIRRLNRLMDATKRVAEGDFTPIMPHRRFRDEFTNLAAAMNSMMSQLMHRHEILVRSHKLRAVGTLTAGVAHELNNPINNIMLTAEMMREDYPDLSDGERLEMVSDLVEQAERAQKIVRNLLDFARESEIETEILDLGDIVRETLALVGNQIKLHDVKLSTEISANLPPVHGDRQHLGQVFLNLILNALDAMPGGGRLHIAAARDEDPAFLAVKITDTGKGIPDHIVGSIFDPFFTTKPTGKGTGLGLSVSLGIVKKHGGNIRVKSRPGEGSTFAVLLPASTVPADIEGMKFGTNQPAPDRQH
ncbi:MAG: HAMP domain-containing sensor histidine kinase [bacterium]